MSNNHNSNNHNNNSKKDLRTNRDIDAKEVRLIDNDGTQLGVLSIEEAIEKAQENGVDLVEVSPGAEPPVCRLLDYGKFKFDQEKKSREQKKVQKQNKIKEVRMQPKIEEHDISFKSRHIQEFLDDGFKVKVTVRFRGRELAHVDYLGSNVLRKVLEHLEEDSYIIDSQPRMEGRLMSMLLSTKKKSNNLK